MTYPTHCPHCGGRIAPVACDHCGERCIEPGDRYCRECGGAHPGIDPETLELVEPEPQSALPDCGSSKPQPRTKQVRPWLPSAQWAWVETEAKRSNMPSYAYLASLIEEYEGGHVEAMALPEGPKEQPRIYLTEDTHTWLHNVAGDLGKAMADVVRWMIATEMAECEASS